MTATLTAPFVPSAAPDRSASAAPAATTRTTVTVARGDGIGPEIMDATLAVLDAAGAGLDYDFIQIGQKVYERGVS
ncbi:MAG: hypothetical protein AAF800_00005, partial [Planctomycetota bacterium]